MEEAINRLVPVTDTSKQQQPVLPEKCPVSICFSKDKDLPSAEGEQLEEETNYRYRNPAMLLMMRSRFL